MARYTRFQAFIILFSLLGIVSAIGFIIYNYARYHLLQIQEENVRLEIEKQLEALRKLPKFKQEYPEGIEYKIPLKKIAKKHIKPTTATTLSEVPGSKPPAKESPPYKLLKCWRCRKPFTAHKTAKRGRCPHCGAEWTEK